jgi:hypothetical protein
MKKSLLLLVLSALVLTTESLLANPNGFGKNVPDGGSTAWLLTAGVFGLVTIARRFRR